MELDCSVKLSVIRVSPDQEFSLSVPQDFQIIFALLFYG